MMNLKFNKSQIQSIVKTYYKVFEDSNVEVSSEAVSGYEGIYEIPCTNVKFTVSQQVSCFGQKITSETTLSEEEVNSILKKMFKEDGYEVESIYYDAGETTGDYFDCGTRSYFSGVTVEVKKLENQKIKTL